MNNISYISNYFFETDSVTIALMFIHTQKTIEFLSPTDSYRGILLPKTFVQSFHIKIKMNEIFTGLEEFQLISVKKLLQLREIFFGLGEIKTVFQKLLLQEKVIFKLYIFL